MPYNKIFITLFLLALAGNATAQRIRDKEGNLMVLRGANEVNFQYSYAGMTVGKEHVPEQEYVDENIDRLNAKRAGKGADWAAGWRRDRTDKFEPEFRAAFEGASGIRLQPSAQARYTLIFHVTHMENGYNIRITRKSAFIDAEVKVVETAHPDHVVASFTIKNCKGRSFDGYDFAANLRLMASFATAGDAVGRLLTGKDMD